MGLTLNTPDTGGRQKAKTGWNLVDILESRKYVVTILYLSPCVYVWMRCEDEGPFVISCWCGDTGPGLVMMMVART